MKIIWHQLLWWQVCIAKFKKLMWKDYILHDYNNVAPHKGKPMETHTKNQWLKWTNQHLSDSVAHNICCFDLWMLDFEKQISWSSKTGNFPHILTGITWKKICIFHCNVSINLLTSSPVLLLLRKCHIYKSISNWG